VTFQRNSEGSELFFLSYPVQGRGIYTLAFY
jgi:hypothetical protein